MVTRKTNSSMRTIAVLALLCFPYCALSFLVTVVTSTLTCGENEVYVSVTKTCKMYASEESYKILDGTTVLKKSAPFANN